MKPKPGAYSKFLAGIIGQALTYATLYYGSNHWVAAAVAVAAALGIYAVPNQVPPGSPGKEGDGPQRMLGRNDRKADAAWCGLPGTPAADAAR